jgi:SAM-dependent methyltransferase
VTALPHAFAADLSTRFEAAFDRAGKIVRAIEVLGSADESGSIAGRDVVLVDDPGGPVRRGLTSAKARIVVVPLGLPLRLALPDASADIVLGAWSAFRGNNPTEIAEVDRVLRPGGRHLVIHDYGRDDVSRILGARPEYAAWSQRGGPFLTGGFRVRVLHCFWDFDSPEEATAFLRDAFGPAGATVAASLKRPRLSYNVAIYHRSKGAGPEGSP